MNYENEMKLEMDGASRNESFARVVVGAFAAQLNPTVEELSDVKTAVSEAVTNAIIHGYEERGGKVYITCGIRGQELFLEIRDDGRGMEDVRRAMEPLYTTKPSAERSGMGFAFMEAFMDDLEVISALGEGTTVRMRKRIGCDEACV